MFVCGIPCSVSGIRSWAWKTAYRCLQRDGIKTFIHSALYIYMQSILLLCFSMDVFNPNKNFEDQFLAHGSYFHLANHMGTRENKKDL